jgi:hypothetical protein
MKVRNALVSFLALGSVVIDGSSLAQAGNSWDGTWKGYWKQRDLSQITVKGVSVMSLKTGHIFAAQINDDTLSYETKTHRVVLTRTGDNTATAISIGTFSGRIRTGSWNQISSGGGAGSSYGLFVRE